MIINETTFNVDCIDVIKELRQQLQINKINLLGVISDTPDNVMVACPYHKDGQERRPSMGIKKSDGTCHCFACGTVVGLPQMISHCWGHDSEIGAFGWEWLLKNFLTIGVEERKDIELDFSRDRGVRSIHDRHNSRTTDSTEHRYVSEEELESYRFIHPYMYKRRLTDEIIEIFDIGYDKNTDCITFPVHDTDGNTLFIARRSVKTKYFNYPMGAVKPLYGLYEYNKHKGKLLDMYCGQIDFREWSEDIIICESMLDALTAWTYGKFAVALNGLGNELQFKQLREMSCRKFILATDADEAGMKARKRIIENIPNKLITQFVWDKNLAKDLNDMDKNMFDNLEEIL